MTRKELINTLNGLLETIDNVQAAVPPRLTRHHDRLNAMRDQAVLLALDMGMPVKPIAQDKEKAPDAADPDQAPAAG